MRQYQPVWLKLKEKGKVSLSADRRLHPRIIKAVKKEKWMDLIYKSVLLENCQNATLSHITTGNKLTFFLHKNIGLSDL